MKQKVTWELNGKKVTWKPNRTPALGWDTLTLLEALTDSAKTFLAFDNIEKCNFQLNNLLTILRAEIEEQKKLSGQNLILRCEYRETKRTRCNTFPIIGQKNGMNLCKKHFKKVKQIVTLESVI